MIWKIQTKGLGQGFSFANKGELMYWMMCDGWEKGISPREVRLSLSSDITSILQIRNAINEKNEREAKVRQAMRGMK